MINLTPEQQIFIKTTVERFLPTAQVYLFGSRAVGHARAFSDLDIAIDAAKKLSFDQLFLIRRAFAESDLPFRVDVSDWQALDIAFKTRIQESRQELK